MLYTKEIEKITFQDVLDFCNQKYRETIHLDYKQEIDNSLAKTIAAMANTWGGLIIIGVEDEDSAPKLPVKGIDYKEHLREQINNIILGNIMPPIFPEIQICSDDKKEKSFVVIRVPQSNLTPHAIKGNTRVYIRTDTSNEPEELTTIDRILWLIDRRKQSTELKDIFYETADKRFHELCNRHSMLMNHTDMIFAICPLYPFEILTDYRKLQREIFEKIRVHRWDHTFPTYSINHSRLDATKNGAYGFFCGEDRKYSFYEELNHFGFFYHREVWMRSIKNDKGSIKNTSSLGEILRKADLFLASSLNFYRELGYRGNMEIKISLKKLRHVLFRDLPVPQGYERWDDITVEPLDDNLEFVKILSYKELSENKKQITIDLTREISWAIGFDHIAEETIMRLFSDHRL